MSMILGPDDSVEVGGTVVAVAVGCPPGVGDVDRPGCTSKDTTTCCGLFNALIAVNVNVSLYTFCNRF